jgi:hypothetical protein
MTDASPVTPAEEGLAGGSYEVIRGRLIGTATALAERAEALNQRRRQEFGGQDLTLLATERIRTANNCVPRDIVPVDRHLLVGFNVFMGLKQERAVGDVFSLHRFAQLADGGFDLEEVTRAEAHGFLEDPKFTKDFEDLFKFFKDARLTALARREARLLATFQTGQTARDVKVLRFAVDAAEKITYLDSRGEGDVPKVPAHDFAWTRAERERFVTGRHPHVNVLDEVFVETVGGDLTVKVENNTEDGQGIYRESVDEPTQSLDDAEFHFARVGALVLLKVLPYRETAYRYLVFNTNTKQVLRVDAIGLSCVGLPEEQGIIFPGGFVLQTGEARIFEREVGQLRFHRTVTSPNGEDVLYVFFAPDDGAYVLVPYNLVRKEVSTPITGHGYSIFSNGQMIVLQGTSPEPSRVHPVQVWQTPFVSPEFAAASPTPQTALGRLGNAELVRGIAEVLTLRRLAESDTPTRRSYEALIAAAQRVVDQFHWLGHAEVGLLPLVQELKKSAELIVDEVEKVVAMRRRAAEELSRVEAAQGELLKRVQVPETLDSAEAYIDALAALRRQRGTLITTKEVRYVDRARLEAMEAEVATAFDELSARCLEYLLAPEAFAPLSTAVDQLDAACGQATKTLELDPLTKEVERLGGGLAVLGEVVGGLAAPDPTEKTRILEAISEVFARLNRVRATLQARRREILGAEKRGEFGSQFKLFAQSIDSALSLSDTPEQCDDALTRLMLQLEELESRFADFDEFAAELASRRDDLLEAFGKRKQVLVDERQRRAQHQFDAAQRILQSVTRRAASFANDDELNAYFAADPMIQKLGQLTAQLLSLRDSVRADELASRLKTAKQEALRALRDRQDLFEGGLAVVKLGPHRFNVNSVALEPTVLPRDEGLELHLGGSDFFEKLDDPDIEAARAYWSQTLPSESPEVYRGEFLAHAVFSAAQRGDGGLSAAQLDQAAVDGGLMAITRTFAAGRYDDGYERGVHDADAAAILEQLVRLHQGADLLRFPPRVRALATLFLGTWLEDPAHLSLQRRAKSLGRLRQRSPAGRGLMQVAQALLGPLGSFLTKAGLEATTTEAGLAARYLAEELAQEPLRLAVTREAVELKDALWGALERAGQRLVLEDELKGLDVGSRFALAREWLAAHAAEVPERATRWASAVDEAAALLAVDEQRISREVSAAVLEVTVTGLLGQHPRVQQGTLQLRLDEFEQRLAWFLEERTPAFTRYRAKVHGLLEAARGRLRLDELKPKVLSTFVRNRLIDEVYLPLIGTNLAKQLGAAGDAKRTDRMGLLLLVSPPGYGKTTLMEYVASRLGLTFVKVNGPSLGHEVVSVDPAEAPNATARQEVDRINFAFELGNNVMLYLDDIQHTNPELLQKFISLCDATRKVEGVWNGRTRTYDLKGKKFCVVMAGNPYTESGDRFRIPDMLANRADTYNLGDILGDKQALFAQSYIENALTSNPVTAPLLTRSAKDLQRIIAMAQGAPRSTNELEHGYSTAELEEVVEVVRRFFFVQRTLLAVNQEYIRSASQDDRFRREPPFKLQGSYRNMNKLAEKIVSAMTDAELEGLLDAHYQSESQTLTTAAEQNLLKLAELRGRMSPEQHTRWEELKRGFRRVQVQGGAEDDPVVRVTGSIAAIGEELGQLKDVVLAAAGRDSPPPPAVVNALEGITRALSIQRSEPELGPRLDALLQAIAGVSRQLAQRPPPRDDLAPAFERLGLVLSELASSRAAPPPAAELTLLLEKLAERPHAAASAPDGMLREEIAHQLLLVQARLYELASAARASLQVDPEASLKAVEVWNEANEAIELIKALPSRGRRRKP